MPESRSRRTGSVALRILLGAVTLPSVLLGFLGFVVGGLAAIPLIVQAICTREPACLLVLVAAPACYFWYVLWGVPLAYAWDGRWPRSRSQILWGPAFNA